MPADKRHRRMRSKLLHVVVAAPDPAAAVLCQPTDRPLGAGARAPFPSGGAPEFRPAVAAILDECCELRIRDRGLGNAKWRDGNLVLPFLVVENKPIAGRRS